MKKSFVLTYPMSIFLLIPGTYKIRFQVITRTITITYTLMYFSFHFIEILVKRNLQWKYGICCIKQWKSKTLFFLRCDFPPSPHEIFHEYSNDLEAKKWGIRNPGVMMSLQSLSIPSLYILVTYTKVVFCYFFMLYTKMQ